jgi:ABC-type transport system involved in cytochrome c biogenesis permease subunit
MNTLLIALYTATCLLYGFTLAARALKWNRGEAWSAVSALMANGLCLGLMAWISGHWPLFNTFESFLFVAFVLGLLGLVLENSENTLPDTRIWIWMEVVLVLLITLFADKTPSLSQYDHGYVNIILFHLFRHLALAVMLFSSAIFIQTRTDRKRGHSPYARSHRGRNFLILSAVLFLIGEYMGILWCQAGWGDFWMWNGGFLQSTLILVYLMLVLHLPRKGLQSNGVSSLLGGLSGFVMLALTILRGLY